jgi:hypothetical protein
MEKAKNIKMNCFAEIVKSNYSRYDKAYNQDDEMSYIDSFIERNWNGKNGSYKAECIHIKKIIS